MKRVGLLGGSFNPAHVGHRRISLFAMKALGLDEVWWLVSPGNPLKPSRGMAPLPARLASARAMARHSPIVPTAIEAKIGTRYTVDTVRRVMALYPRTRFVWLMGADNLRQLHHWKDWRNLARMIAIAVIARPGYDESARAARAMGWLRRFVRPSRRAAEWTCWSKPAIVLLRFDPDPASATMLRTRHPDWYKDFNGRKLRDRLTRRLVS